MNVLRLGVPLFAVLFFTRPVLADHHHHDDHHDHHDRDRNGVVIIENRPAFGFYSRPYYDGGYYYDAPRVYDAHRYRSLPMDVQAALSSRGYYRGPIDGDIGPGSRAAIRAYQRDHRLPMSGRIDDPLLRALRL